MVTVHILTRSTHPSCGRVQVLPVGQVCIRILLISHWDSAAEPLMGDPEVTSLISESLWLFLLDSVDYDMLVLVQDYFKVREGASPDSRS